MRPISWVFCVHVQNFVEAVQHLAGELINYSKMHPDFRDVTSWKNVSELVDMSYLCFSGHMVGLLFRRE